MQKYHFTDYDRNTKQVVEVSENKEKNLLYVPGKNNYLCLCRGFGQNNKEPRRKYRIMAATPSQAARYAIVKYREDISEIQSNQ